MAGSHGYHVVNCFERGHLKFILIRNPWGGYVRDYKAMERVISGKKVTVLSAKEENNTDGIFSEVNNFFSTPRISQAALPITNAGYYFFYRSNGYLTLELSDLKRFGFISSTVPSLAVPKEKYKNNIPFPSLI